MKLFRLHRSKVILAQLIAIVSIGLILRFRHFPDNVYFGFDQAIHAFNSQKVILERDVTLQGPGTDVAGVFHGPLYYYLIGPLYLLAKGSPLVVAALLLVANAFGAILVFQLGKSLYSSQVGLLAAVFFAVSFEQYQFGYYLSNPSLGVLSMIVVYWGLVEFVFKRRKIGLWLVALGIATATHFEFFLIYLLGFSLVWLGYGYSQQKTTFSQVVKDVLGPFCLGVVLLSNFWWLS